MFKTKYAMHHDDIITNTTPLLSCESINNVNVDPSVRYISIGIVNMVEPIKKGTNEKERNIKYVIFDNLNHNMISFDVYDLYHSFIKYDINFIDTKYGKYTLSQKTIKEITNIVDNNYDSI